MATKSKTSKKSKTTMQKIHHLMASDIFKSVAIVSILANVFFVILILVGGQYPTLYLTSGSYKQRAARLESAQKSFCQKDIIDQYLNEAKNNGNEKSANWFVATNCGSGQYGEQLRDLKEQVIGSDQ